MTTDMTTYKQELIAKLDEIIALNKQGQFEKVWGYLNSATSPFNMYEELTGDFKFKADCMERVADGFLSARPALRDGEPVEETINAAFRSAARLITITSIGFRTQIQHNAFWQLR